MSNKVPSKTTSAPQPPSKVQTPPKKERVVDAFTQLDMRYKNITFENLIAENERILRLKQDLKSRI